MTDDGVLLKYVGSSSTVKLPTNVKIIAPGAFEGNESISTVMVPDTVTSIAENAFKNSGVKKINIPKSVSYIGKGAFEDTPYLNSNDDEFMVVGDGVLIKCDPSVSGGKVVIPEGVKSISGGTFANMAISEIEFPNTLTHIGDEAFLCTDIRDLEFPNSLKMIGKRAFGTVEEKYNQDAIYTYYYYQSEIETIKFGSSLEIIDDGAFFGPVVMQ